MDSKDSGRLGGLKRFANMTPTKVRRVNRAAARASWARHIKNNKKCLCKRCKQKRTKRP